MVGGINDTIVHRFYSMMYKTHLDFQVEIIILITQRAHERCITRSTQQFQRRFLLCSHHGISFTIGLVVTVYCETKSACHCRSNLKCKNSTDDQIHPITNKSMCIRKQNATNYNLRREVSRTMDRVRTFFM